MPAGSRQHIVPQMMIRRFASDDGTLIELYKPSLAIATHRKHPRQILWIDNFYRDCLSDFDAEILQGVEQQFARYYPLIVGHDQPHSLSRDGSTAFIDWVAAMLCRTRAIVCLSHEIVHQNNTFFCNILPLITNTIRLLWFIEMKDIMTRSNYRWSMKVLQRECNIVLTDNPVCQTNGINQGGQITLVPLSKKHILIGGVQEAVDEARSWTIDQVNAFLAAWAEKSIFAANQNDLEIIKENLEGNGIIGTNEWCENARKPFFGLIDRIYSRQPPSSEHLADWWKEIKAEFGVPL